jgi:nucleotide-binding universal stress UspA family protein
VVGIPVESHPKPAEVIPGQASRHDIGLMVMGAYGKSTIREFFIRLVTRALLEKSLVAVFRSH